MTTDTPDHRVRVGRQRSARTRRRILAAALPIFAERGPDAPVISDFVEAAGISRGTFYHHFKGVEELLEATSEWTTRELIHTIEAALDGVQGPVMRFGTGLRLFFHLARPAPVWCRFVARVWSVGGLEFPIRDVLAGMEQGLLSCPSLEAAHALVSGGVRAALERMGEGDAPPDLGDQLTALVLRGFGADPGCIAAVLSAPLPAHVNPLVGLRAPAG